MQRLSPQTISLFLPRVRTDPPLVCPEKRGAFLPSLYFFNQHFLIIYREHKVLRHDRGSPLAVVYLVNPSLFSKFACYFFNYYFSFKKLLDAI